jgi:copper chaperone NosL
MSHRQCFELIITCLLMVMAAVFAPRVLGEEAIDKVFPFAGPPPAFNGLGPGDSLSISPRDHCPVCGMYPSRIPQCAAGMRLEDGRTYYFCSNRCLLLAWRRPRTYLGPQAVVSRLVVLDYFSGQPLDGARAWWITGSDVIGPMGPALVTLDTQKDVAAFVRRHGSTHRFKLDQIDEALWRTIMPAEH